MKRLLVFTLVALTLPLLLSSCGYSLAELTEARKAGYDEGYKAGFDEGRASVTKKQEAIGYSKRYIIDTEQIAAAKVLLGKGDVFEARMSFQYGAIVFWVSDPYLQKVVDGGRIEKEYEFAFVAEVSGDYMLVFKDVEGSRNIYFEYNSPSPLCDASVR